LLWAVEVSDVRQLRAIFVEVHSAKDEQRIPPRRPGASLPRRRRGRAPPPDDRVHPLRECGGITFNTKYAESAFPHRWQARKRSRVQPMLGAIILNDIINEGLQDFAWSITDPKGFCAGFDGKGHCLRQKRCLRGLEQNL
jgi:hypothetical protein